MDMLRSELQNQILDENNFDQDDNEMMFDELNVNVQEM